MKIKQFQQALEQPQNLGEHDVDSLCEVLQRFPWFNTAHILLAKAYQKEGNPAYAEQLHLAAVYAGNPEVLYDLMLEKEVLELVTEKENSVVEQESAVVPTEEKLDQSEAEVSSTGLPTKELDEDPGGGLKEPASDVETDEEQQALERQILTSAVSASIEQEVSHDVDRDSFPAAEEKTNEEVQNRAGIDTSAMSAYSQWLLKRAGDLSFGEQMPRQRPPVNKPETSTWGLVDKFIKDEPSIKPSKVEQYTTGDLAKKSLVEDESLITETMAQIYAKQGKMDKAKRAYELLSLKYPEKSVYFAAQFEKLRGGIK